MNMIRYETNTAVVASPAKYGSDSLPALLDRAAAALVAAKSSAEVLEARDMAKVAYDAAKTAGRILKAKQAHDTVLAEVYRAQADALMIEARAKMILAEEFDAAQNRGEVGVSGARNDLVNDTYEVKPTVSDVFGNRVALQEARQIRDAEKENPGSTARALNDLVARGEEPTKAKLNREIISKPKPAPQKVMDQSALWLWGRLKDFERDGVLDEDAAFLISEMTEPMRADVKRISPLVRDFLRKMEQFA